MKSSATVLYAVAVFTHGVCPDGGLAFGQQQTLARHTSPRKAELDPQLKSLINDADGTLPEFKADILLSLVETGKISDLTLNPKLVSRAYAAAQTVQPPFAEAPYGRVGSTPQGRKAVALSITQLDAMSLQSRAVHDMQTLNPVRAKAMFDAVAFPRLDPLTCSDNWIYDPTPFYTVLAEITENDFASKDVADGKRTTFLLPYVTRLSSHAQVIPVAHLLATAKLAPEEMRQLAPAYAESLASIPKDALTFAAIAEDSGNYVESVYGSAGLSDAMSALVSTMERADVPPGVLLRGLRDYLVENFNGPRCNPKKPGEPAPPKNTLPSAVVRFNQNFSSILKRNAIPPISSSELPKADILATSIWNSTDDSSQEAQRLTKQIQQLHDSRNRSAKEGAPSDAWWRELDDFLSQFNAWSQGDEEEIDYLDEKASFFQALIELIPKSTQRQRVIENFVDFLGQHSYQNLGGAQWFIYSKLFLLNMSARDSHAEIVSAFLNSRDPVLSLYARLELWSGKAIGPHWPASP